MGPTWPYLLMYGSHNMRHIGFRRLTVVNGTPRDLGRHSACEGFKCNMLYINIRILLFITYLSKLDKLKPNVLKL